MIFINNIIRNNMKTKLLTAFMLLAAGNVSAKTSSDTLVVTTQPAATLNVAAVIRSAGRTKLFSALES